MKKYISLLLFLLSTTSSADSVDKLRLYQTEDPEKLTPGTLRKKKEIYLEKESLIRDTIGDTGLYSEYYYTRRDSGRLSIAYHTSHDYESFDKLQTIDFQYMSKMNSYKDQWWGVQIKRVAGDYSAFANELEKSSTHPNADSQFDRLDARQSMTLFGFGFGYRFKVLSNLFESNRIFEQIMAYGNYIYHLDEKTSDKYQGYGATMEYGLHKRMGLSFFAGGKLSYNLASLVRPEKTDEDKIDRSLVFRWTSIAFEIGYYY